MLKLLLVIGLLESWYLIKLGDVFDNVIVFFILMRSFKNVFFFVYKLINCNNIGYVGWIVIFFCWMVLID